MAKLIDRVQTKTNQIRDRIKFRKKVPLHTLNESHAREFVARVMVLPQLKKKFGTRLKAVFIVGSVQLGVRKALQNNKSDLDVVVFIKGVKRKEYASGLVEKIKLDALKTGVRLNLIYRDSSQIKSERKRDEPFQILYGARFVKKILGEKELTKQKIKKKRYLKMHGDRF